MRRLGRWRESESLVTDCRDHWTPVSSATVHLCLVPLDTSVQKPFPPRGRFSPAAGVGTQTGATYSKNE